MGNPNFFEMLGKDVPEHLQRQRKKLPRPDDTVPDPEQPGRVWASRDAMFWGVTASHGGLPAGLYRCGSVDGIGPFLSAQRNDTDELLLLPDSEAVQIVAEIAAFQGLRQQFHSRGFLHKRGILLWGPPGSGKTSVIQLLIDLVVEEHGGIAVYVDNPSLAADCFQMVRQIEPERPIIALLEDFDALVGGYGEAQYLALLDGEKQVDNIVFVATTNYPERLDRRIVDRPSRFDLVRYIAMPSPIARRAYLLAKEPGLAELDEFVARSEGMSLAHLRELIILTQCFGHSLDAAVERLDSFRVLPVSEPDPRQDKLRAMRQRGTEPGQVGAMLYTSTNPAMALP